VGLPSKSSKRHYPSIKKPIILSNNLAVALSGAYSIPTYILHGTMVVFLDLDEDASDHVDPDEAGYALSRRLPIRPVTTNIPTSTPTAIKHDEIETPNPNLNSLSAALGCYP